MSLYTILETLLIGPLKLLFEIIFQIADRFVSHPGVSIIFLSLAMNILVLPLYKRADAMQEESRLTEEKLGKGIAHIKKTFSGDEKMMILQTYYRQNHYSPANALKGSTSLLLEIPFFMAAYQFLSHLQALEGVSLGPIADLSAPDGLLVIGGIAINVLPVLMTLVNVISAALYLKGFPLKTKIQLYGMAAFFLVFLYTSPSGLVFYWTLNNVFSLVKNIFYKLKNPAKVLSVLTALVGAVLAVIGITVFGPAHPKKMAITILLGVALVLPLVSRLLKKVVTVKARPAAEVKNNKKAFVLGSVFLTILVGVLIPATFIAASPQEYVDVSYFHNPLWYIVSSGAMAAGFFLVWLRVFYWLADAKWKVIFERLVWIACGVMLVNYMFFGTDLGIISASLQYENGMNFQLTEQLINLGVILVLALALWFVAARFSKVAVPVLLTAAIALGAMSGVHIVTISNSVNNISVEQADSSPNFALSTEGQNVIVLMLDRALGEYIPYLFNENPELEEQFDGFTYYDNVISFGGFTNVGTPALFGGYEYTPVEMNKRSSETLGQKHTEALKVMPYLFAENEYDVTVCDPVYANYQWIPDLSIYDEYPQIDTYITKGAFGSTAQKQQMIENNYRNFFCFSLMKTMPLILQPEIYQEGGYNRTETTGSAEITASVQTQDGMSTAVGVNQIFMESYNVLTSLPNMTKITEGNTNTFMMMVNETTHEPMLLQEPEYIPAEKVDNTAYDAANEDRFTVDGRTLKMENERQMIHYQTNMATMIQLGKWFDYMRQEGVYDNTRIILVSDHGQHLHHLDELEMGDGTMDVTGVELYFPLLMVKEFNAEGFTTDHTFMTNADVPTLATGDVIENPVNPFTGKPINSDEKTAHDQYILMTFLWNINENRGTCYQADMWASVKDDLWKKENWNFCFEETILSDHSFPVS